MRSNKLRKKLKVLIILTNKANKILSTCMHLKKCKLSFTLKF